MDLLSWLRSLWPGHAYASVFEEVELEWTDADSPRCAVSVWDPWRVGLFAFGLFLILSARSLSQSLVLYYSSGFVLGVIFALSMLLFFIYRNPKQTGIASAAVGLFSFASQYIPSFHESNTVLRFVIEHWQLVVGVVVFVVAMIVGGFVYVHGPPSERMQTVLYSGFSMTGLLCILLSLPLVVATTAAFVIVWRSVFLTVLGCVTRSLGCVCCGRARSARVELRDLTPEELEAAGADGAREDSSCAGVWCCLCRWCCGCCGRRGGADDDGIAPPVRYVDRFLSADEMDQQSELATEIGLRQLRLLTNNPVLGRLSVEGRRRFGAFLVGENHIPEELALATNTDIQNLSSIRIGPNGERLDPADIDDDETLEREYERAYNDAEASLSVPLNAVSPPVYRRIRRH